jgi:transcriptional regulator with XRE-family HTH domain
LPQNTVLKAFSERLAQERREKQARERRDIYKQDVAKAVGVSQATYGRYEAGLSMPDGDTLVRLAAFFGVTPSWLHYGQEPREAPAKGREVKVITELEPVPRATKKTAKRSSGRG